jgi:hypothetical protein
VDSVLELVCGLTEDVGVNPVADNVVLWSPAENGLSGGSNARGSGSPVLRIEMGGTSKEPMGDNRVIPCWSRLLIAPAFLERLRLRELSMRRSELGLKGRGRAGRPTCTEPATEGEEDAGDCD